MEKSEKLERCMIRGRIEVGRGVTMPGGPACAASGGGLGLDVIWLKVTD